jgi:hypothetical protein
VNYSSPVVKCRKVAHSRNPPPVWVGFLSVPSQGQAEREESASLANFGLQPCCSTHCTLVRQRLYTLAHYTCKRESTFDPNGILIWTSLFWLPTITGTLVRSPPQIPSRDPNSPDSPARLLAVRTVPAFTVSNCLTGKGIPLISSFGLDLYSSQNCHVRTSLPLVLDGDESILRLNSKGCRVRRWVDGSKNDSCEVRFLIGLRSRDAVAKRGRTPSD